MVRTIAIIATATLLLTFIPAASATPAVVPGTAGPGKCWYIGLPGELCVGNEHDCIGVYLQWGWEAKCYGVHTGPQPGAPSDCERILDIQGGGPATGWIAISGGGNAEACLLGISGDGKAEGAVCYEPANQRIGIFCHEEGMWFPVPGGPA